MKSPTKSEMDFIGIDYLKNGTHKQRLAYTTLTTHKIMSGLKQFDPILVGTIPINIDTENSDLDIICCYQDSDEFIKVVKSIFCNYKDFKITESDRHLSSTVIANFKIDSFEIEVFGQNIPTKEQSAYRHMIIEYKLLCERDEAFRQNIIDLKRKGYKTEPAFGLVLGLSGNPYHELLKYEDRD